MADCLKLRHVERGIVLTYLWGLSLGSGRDLRGHSETRFKVPPEFYWCIHVRFFPLRWEPPHREVIIQVMSSAWCSPDIVLWLSLKELVCWLIRPESLFPSFPFIVLSETPIRLSRAFDIKWLLSRHSTIKAWLMEGCWEGGRLQRVLRSQHRTSDHRVIGLLPDQDPPRLVTPAEVLVAPLFFMGTLKV